ncbi:glycosyltransferase family 1 protein [Sphingobium sp. CR2-8]|uniref:glycosyltransferase family 4 protein n=1 Tax=Sphingobium sp. CR2-8 TaxID=1306534 RepID=UPI002DB5F119|nr:glycosyltransferase family 1 protein [Sphingobium sp. CR2-8]MEC3912793.1 glycosyltransferase family 1 protein [Sphingobium sp. CR2-8]
MRNIAIRFELDEDWIGGSYYFRNLISALALLPEEEQVFIYIICEKMQSVSFLRESGYHHIGWVKTSEYDSRTGEPPFDAIFPYPDSDEESTITISWIPDFQELHLRQFFSDNEIAQRQGHHRRRFATAGLIVSSHDVANDVQTFYPGECQNIAVVRFASFDKFDASKCKDIRAKYNMPARYIICANQVWIHKNHIVIMRAVYLLKQRGIYVDVVFTGKESDYRVPGYSEMLKQQAVEWGIQDRIHFLGFIPREDQLCLMKEADYVVQPSLFEGWSTVIEDAKAMGKFIVASDLNVHKEQLPSGGRFFFRHDPKSLADVMQEVSSQATPLLATIDYHDARRNFARDFLAAVDQFLPSQPRSPQRQVALDRIVHASQANMRNIDQIEIRDHRITGLSPVEGPYQESGLTMEFRWMNGQEFEIPDCLISANTAVIQLTFRNICRDQWLQIYVNDNVLKAEFQVERFDLGYQQQIAVDLSDFINQRCSIKVRVDKVVVNDVRTLGLLVEKIDFCPVGG